MTCRKRLGPSCVAALALAGCDGLWLESGPTSPRLGFFKEVTPAGVTVEWPGRPNIPG